MENEFVELIWNQKFMVTIKMGTCRYYDSNEDNSMPTGKYQIISWSDSYLPMYQIFFDSQEEAEAYYEVLNLEDFIIPRPGKRIEGYGRKEKFLIKELAKVEIETRVENEPHKIIDYNEVTVINYIKRKERHYNETIDSY